MNQFKQLKVKEVKKETADSVSVAFDLTENIAYQAGQYITIKHDIAGEEVRRSYSLCSAPHESDFRVAVKKIEGGKMSTFLNDSISAGDNLEVMLPMGNFLLEPEDGKNYVAFGVGSGITPILSMVKTVLEKSNSKFTLYYGNRTTDSTIFKTELDELVRSYEDRLTIKYLFTQQKETDSLFEGRINREKFDALVKDNPEMLKADAFYLCGPEDMINDVSDGLSYLGVDKDKVNFELFFATAKVQELEEGAFDGDSQLTVIMDGDEFEFELNSKGDFILDAAMSKGVDAPFSCKGAVCCTCKAQVIEGKATMDMNYALSDEEVAEGFILTCQSRPASAKLVVDFDVI